MEQLIRDLIDKVEKLDGKLETHIDKEEEKIKEIKDAVSTLKVDTQGIAELKESFTAAKHVVVFIKWSAAIIAAIALSLAFLKTHITIGIK